MFFMATLAVADSDLERFLADKIMDDYPFDPANTEIRLVRSNLTIEDVSDYVIKAYPMSQSTPRGRFPMLVELYQNDQMVDKGSVSVDVASSRKSAGTALYWLSSVAVDLPSMRQWRASRFRFASASG